MSWIRRESPDTVAEPMRTLFERIRAGSPHAMVAHLWQTMALDPPALERLHLLYRGLMDDPAPLSGAQVHMIAVVVSATNGCGYGVAHHGPLLARALGDETLARAVARDYRSADLAARDRVLLDACVALTCEPSERTRADIERLREYGFDDAGILKAIEIAAVENAANRLELALGITLEPALEAWEFGAQR